MFNLIIPMGGKGERFTKLGFAEPKPLIRLQERPFFYWATQSLMRFLNPKKLVFVILKEHEVEFGITATIRAFFPQAEIAVLDEVLNGPIFTCLEGVKLIDNDAPVIMCDCDVLFYSSALLRFLKDTRLHEKVDGAVTSFVSTKPCYSFLKEDAAGNVLQTAEKVPISSTAICGTYYFRSAQTYRETMEAYLANKIDTRECYMSELYNVLISRGGCVRHFPLDLHLSFGTPEEFTRVMDNDLFQFFK